MARVQHPEPEALRRACLSVLEHLQAGPWMAPEAPAITDLANSLKAYYIQTRRLYRIVKTREICRQHIEACERANVEVRRSVGQALDMVEGLSPARAELAVPLMEHVAVAADQVNKLTTESPLRNRVGSMRALEDACLKLLDFMAEPEMQSRPQPVEEPKPVEVPAPVPAAQPPAPAAPVHVAPAHAPVVHSPPAHSAPVHSAPAHPALAPAHTAPAQPAPAAEPKPVEVKPAVEHKPVEMPSGATFINPGAPTDGRSIPRLPVGKLLEFLNGQTLPDGTAALKPFLDKNPDDTLPNSWIQAGSCPICGKDVLVAFGKSRKETIFCQGGHLLKFNQTQALVAT